MVESFNSENGNGFLVFREKGEDERMREKDQNSSDGGCLSPKPLNPKPCKKRPIYPSSIIPMHLTLKGNP